MNEDRGEKPSEQAILSETDDLTLKNVLFVELTVWMDFCLQLKLASCKRLIRPLRHYIDDFGRLGQD